MVKKSATCLVRSDWSIGISRGSCLNHRWMLLDPTAALTPSPSHPNPNFPDPLLSPDPLSPSRPTAATPSQSLDPQPPSRRRPPSSPPTPIADNPSPPLLSHGRAHPFQIAASTSSLPDRGRLLPRSVSIRLPLDSSRLHPPPASSLSLLRPPARARPSSPPRRAPRQGAGRAARRPECPRRSARTRRSTRTTATSRKRRLPLSSGPPAPARRAAALASRGRPTGGRPPFPHAGFSLRCLFVLDPDLGALVFPVGHRERAGRREGPHQGGGGGHQGRMTRGVARRCRPREDAGVRLPGREASRECQCRRQQRCSIRPPPLVSQTAEHQRAYKLKLVPHKRHNQ